MLNDVNTSFQDNIFREELKHEKKTFRRFT